MTIKNNARSSLVIDLQSDATTFMCKEWEWDLFPESEFELFIEKFVDNNWKVEAKKRESVWITLRAGDVFTCTKAYDKCVQDDTEDPKVSTKLALSFDSWDTITQYVSSDVFKKINDSITALQDNKLDSDDDTVTKQWNTFNTANKLVKANAQGKILNELLPQAQWAETTLSNITLWETVNAWNYLRFWRWNITNNITNWSFDNWSYGSNIWTTYDVKTFVTWNLPETINEVSIAWKTNGGNSFITLYITDSSNTVLYTSNSPTFTYNSNVAYSQAMSFTGVSLLPNTTYKIRMTVSAYFIYSVVSWTSNIWFDFDLISNEPSTKFYKASSSELVLSKWRWVADSSWSLDDTIKMITSLVNNKQTGLTVWNSMYLSDTPGVISTTPWTNKVKVWVCISESAIILNEEEVENKPNTTFTTTRAFNQSNWPITYSHNLWRVPKNIQLYTMDAGGNLKNICNWSETQSRTMYASNNWWIFSSDIRISISDSFWQTLVFSWLSSADLTIDYTRNLTWTNNSDLELYFILS